MEPFEVKKLPSEGENRASESTAPSKGFVPFNQAFYGNSSEKSGEHVSAENTECSEESSIEYVEEQGVVKKIRVTCGCGKVTEIECLYDS